MTAEFDSSGFSAVDKFFGNGAEGDTEKKLTGSSAIGINSAATGRSKRRGGVGTSSSNNVDSAKQLSSDILAKQVLSVGRKRSRDEDNNEFHEARDGVDDHGVEDGDEADGGRTTIVKKKKTPKNTVVASASNNNNQPNNNNAKNKKKLGKKERLRQKQTVNIEVFEAVEQEQLTGDIVVTETTTNENTAAIAKTGGSPGSTKTSTATYPTTKRKRRKVRSRQKNIRKDNRSADEKPAHLIRGNHNYQGRPMTQATREKLNLPPPNKSKHRTNFSNQKTTSGDPSSLFVIDRNPESAGDDVGVKLAIDEFMGSSNYKKDDHKSALLNEHKDDTTKLKEKTSSKKKKKRFKNL